MKRAKADRIKAIIYWRDVYGSKSLIGSTILNEVTDTFVIILPLNWNPSTLVEKRVLGSIAIVFGEQRALVGITPVYSKLTGVLNWKALVMFMGLISRA